LALRRGRVAANVIGLAKVWNFMTVRPADEHIKETKFSRNDKCSQQTKSVAKICWRVRKCQAEN
jgi:hypothetical protein